MFIKVNMKKYENIITLNMNDTKTHLILVSRLFCTSILHKIHLINHFFFNENNKNYKLSTTFFLLCYIYSPKNVYFRFPFRLI